MEVVVELFLVPEGVHRHNPLGTHSMDPDSTDLCSRGPHSRDRMGRKRRRVQHRVGHVVNGILRHRR